MFLRIAACFLLTSLLVACALAPKRSTIFHVEPTNRFTFTAGEDIAKGTVLNVRFNNLGTGEIFLVNRCGELCNTSKVVAQARGPQVPDDKLTYTFAESGQYYFWVQQQLDSGESGPVLIESFQGDAHSFSALFKSGAKITGDISVAP